MTPSVGPTRRDSRSIPDSVHEVRAFLVVQNERDRLPHTLAHHRRLGVQRFFVIDNASTDGTFDYLLNQPDTHVFVTDDGYQDARLGIDWLEPLLQDYGMDRWCLVIDADEHFVYPDCESLSISEFCEALDARELNCVATLFIDLYADKAIAQTTLQPGRSPIECCPYFDRTGYYSLPPQGSRLPRIYGGVRARLFWPDVDLRHQADRLSAVMAEAFDEQTYLSIHEDVRAAVDSGVLVSGLQHFLLYGHHEGRTASVRPVPAWEEDTYLAGNPDVADAVRRGDIINGLEHYVRCGQFETRLPAGVWPPCLSQLPLVRWQQGMHFQLGRHGLTGASWPRGDVCGGALLHFKLVAGLAVRAHAASRPPTSSSAAPVWSEENDRYRRVLLREPDLTGMSTASVRYRGAEQLVELNLAHRLETVCAPVTLEA